MVERRNDVVERDLLTRLKPTLRHTVENTAQTSSPKAPSIALHPYAESVL